MTSTDTHRDHLWAISTRCVACGSCEDACGQRHGVARLRRPRHGQPIVFPEVCRHCDSPACVESCISGCLTIDIDSGHLKSNNDRCMGCWSCILACPHGAVRQDLRDLPLSARCHRCREYRNLACASGCPTGAIQFGDDDALGMDLAKGGGIAGPLVATALCLILPVMGLIVGFMSTGWAYRHALGILAAVAMGVSLLLPLVGRILTKLTGRRFWVTMHVVAGVLMTTLAMVHAGGRFGFNAQSAAAMLLLVLVVTAIAYRYLLPSVLVWEATFFCRAAAVHCPADDGRADKTGSDRASIEAMAAGSRQAQAWFRLLHHTANALASCRAIHVVVAILAAGLVLAHAIIMTFVGAE